MSDSEDDASDRQLKLVLLGDACVGKTCLATRYCSNAFAKQYLPTSGVEFLLKRDVLQKTKNVTIHIWDVGGSFKKLIDNFVFNANIVIVVYDVTNEVSFLTLPSWVEIVRTVVGPHGNPPTIAIVGNKCDMEHQRIVKLDRQNKLAAELHVTSYTASARTGEGVSLTFHRIIADFMGIRLTRSQVEEYHKVVRAEISTHSTVTAPPQSKIPVPSSSSSFYIFGTDVGAIPCFRSTLLYGTGVGIAGGLIHFLFTSKTRLSCHVGYGTFLTTSIFYWIRCRYVYAQNKFSMTQLQEAYKEYTLKEGTNQKDVKPK